MPSQFKLKAPEQMPYFTAKSCSPVLVFTTHTEDIQETALIQPKKPTVACAQKELDSQMSEFSI